MRSCPECKINVDGGLTHCPLCGTVLTSADTGVPEEVLYPEFGAVGKRKSSFPFLARLFAAISVAAILSTGLVNLLISGKLTWSLFVISSIVMLWLTVGVHLLSSLNLNYKLLIDLCVASAWLIVIDRLTGWSKWSVNYVVPILYIGIMIAVITLALVFRMYWREYLLSLLAGCALGIVPLVIFFRNESPIRYLCLGAALLAAVVMIGILFFAGGKLFSEWRRRMNL